MVVKCIDEIIKAYKISEENITLLGFSQGTILSFAMALNYPERAQPVIGLSGYLNEGFLKTDMKIKIAAT